MLRRLLGMAPRGPLAVRLRRFAIVGVTAAVVQQVLLFALLRLVQFNYLVAAAVSIAITIVFQYILNNVWTFSADRKTGRRAYAYGLLKTSLVRGSAIPLQLGLLYGFRQILELEAARAALMDQYAFVTALSGVPVADQIVLLANLLAIPISGLYRYALDARWTWG